MIRIFLATILGILVLAAMPPASRADTLRFTAQLSSDDNPATTAAVRGQAAISLDTASKVATWTIEYSGMVRPPREVGCGVMEPPGAPAIRQSGTLASPVSGSKALTEAEITALTAGHWACVVNGDGEDADIGGVLQPQR